MSHRPHDPLAAVLAACTELLRNGRPVTFTAIAARTGISRSSLYRRSDLRELVEQHRDPTTETISLTGLADQLDQLRHALDAVATNVRRHEEQLRAPRGAISPYHAGPPEHRPQRLDPVSGFLTCCCPRSPFGYG